MAVLTSTRVRRGRRRRNRRIAFGVDVGDPDACGRRRCGGGRLGGLSVIYNNAGTSAFNKLHEHEHRAEWDRVLRVNLTGVWAGIRARRRTCSPAEAAPLSARHPSAGQGRPRGESHAASKAAVAASRRRPPWNTPHQGGRTLAGHDPYRHDSRCSSSCPPRRSASRRARPCAGSVNPRTSLTSSCSSAPPGPVRRRAEHRRRRRFDPPRLRASTASTTSFSRGATAT